MRWTNSKSRRWQRLRADPNQLVTEVSDSLFSDRVRLVAPVIMGAACVSCHNCASRKPQAGLEGRRRARHPGGEHHAADRRQPVLVQVPADLFRRCWRRPGITFIVHAAAPGAAVISGMNRELETANEFLASLSMKISRYLSPQIYKSIFSGQKRRHHPHRAQEAHDLLLRHQGFHRDHRAPAARADHAAAQRVFHRDVARSRSSTAAPSTSSSATRC